MYGVKVKICGITNKADAHLVVDSGVCGLRYIQELPGHKSSKMAEIYTHVSNKGIGKMKSPLDRLFEKE